VVGGTGLYLRAALTELSLAPPPPAELRARLEAALAERGPAALHEELRARAPVAAAAIAPTDRTRIVRSLELLELGADPPRTEGSELWTAQTRVPTRLFGLTMDREALYERIDARVDAIVAAGGAEEARTRRARLRGADRGRRRADEAAHAPVRTAAAHLDAQAPGRDRAGRHRARAARAGRRGRRRSGVIGPPPEVRAATAADRGSLAGVLARAFDDDPVMTWFFQDRRRRDARNRRFFAMRLRQLMPHGETYTVDGTLGAAVWAAPERWRLGRIEELRLALAMLPGVWSRLGEVLEGLESIDRAHPRTPHYYLAVLGTDPEAQGRGIGSALLRPTLDACDRDGVPAYLESSKERNIDFYARHGFRVTAVLELPDGPRVWSMWRDPWG
jgi:GNAT superfamily N-acetyltransferase